MKKLLLFLACVILMNYVYAQWQPTDGPPYKDASGVSGYVSRVAVNGNNIFAATGLGMYLSTNGNNWNLINTGLTIRAVNAIAFSGNNIFVGTGGKGVFMSSNNGSNWIAVNNNLTNLYVDALAINGNYIFAGMNNLGGICLSTNNGSNWVPSNSGLPTNFSYITALAINGNYIFAGTLYNGVYLSSNNGVSWKPVNTGLIHDTISSFAVSNNNIFAGTLYGNKVYLSSNNGTNWTEVTNGLPKYNNRILLAASGSVIFAGTSSGIFISKNNGGLWSYFGLTERKINSLAIKGDTLFAGTDSLVWKQSFSVLTEIKDINNRNEISIYPNPATDNIIIETPQQATIEITNIEGQIIKKLKTQGNNTNIDISNFSIGVYFIRAQTDRGITTVKFIKK